MDQSASATTCDTDAHAAAHGEAADAAVTPRTCSGAGKGGCAGCCHRDEHAHHRD